MTLDMKWVVEFSLCSPAPLRCGGDYAAGVVWEEIIKLQTLKMRLLLWPRQSSLFLLTAALCSLIAIIEAVIASRKMTFPLVLRRGRASFCCILSLSLSLLQHFMTPLTMFLSMAEMERMFVNIPVSHRLYFTLNGVIFQLGGQVGVTKLFTEELFSLTTVWHVTKCVNNQTDHIPHYQLKFLAN